MFRKLAEITKRIFVVENRGLDDTNTQTAIAELAAHMDEKHGYSVAMTWMDPALSDSSEELELSDSSEELDLHKYLLINCAVLVFSAHHDRDTNRNGLAEVIDFFCQHQGRHPVAVITHVDIQDDKLVQDLKSDLGHYGISDIFVVANITNGNPSLDEIYQHSLLSLLKRCTTIGVEILLFKRLPLELRTMFLNCEIEKKREENRQMKIEKWTAEEIRKRKEREYNERENQMRRESEQHKLQVKRQNERTVELERKKQELEQQLHEQAEDIASSRKLLDRQRKLALEFDRKKQELEQQLQKQVEEHNVQVDQQHERTMELERKKQELEQQLQKQEKEHKVQMDQQYRRAVEVLLKKIDPYKRQSFEISTSSSAVETNGSIAEVSEEELSKLASKLGQGDDVRDLALQLGFPNDKWKLYSARNRTDGEVSCVGTFNMLTDWKKKILKDYERTVLGAALIKADFAGLAEEVYMHTD